MKSFYIQKIAIFYELEKHTKIAIFYELKKQKSSKAHFKNQVWQLVLFISLARVVVGIMKVGWWTAVENGSGDGGRHFITFIFNKVIGFLLGASLKKKIYCVELLVWSRAFMFGGLVYE